MSKAKDFLIAVKNFISLIRKEVNSSVSAGLVNSLNCYTKGFLSESYILYDFKNCNSDNYLSDLKRFISVPGINKEYGYFLDNKLLFDIYFSDICKIVKCEGLLTSGTIYCNEGVLPVYESLLNLLKSGNDVVLKPIKGGGGYGILFLTYSEGRVLLNGSPEEGATLMEKINGLKGYVAYKKIRQKGLLNSIYPSTLNTIRVLTMADPITKVPFIPAAVQRFGTSLSGYVDNWSSGGICANIDINTGIMGKAVGYPKNNNYLSWYSNHPDSSRPIEGVKIPSWEPVMEAVLDAASRVSFIPYVGWDIVLSDNEILFLEANTNSDVNLIQVHKPLLSMKGVREFYKYHKVL